MGDFAVMMTIDEAQVRLQRARTIRKARPESTLDIRYAGKQRVWRGEFGKGPGFMSSCIMSKLESDFVPYWAKNIHPETNHRS
jgi:hypothetical protein